MATKKITDTPNATSVNESADWLLVQNEHIDGETKKVFRKATTDKVVEALRNAGINDGYLTQNDADEIEEKVMGLEQKIENISPGTGGDIQKIKRIYGGNANG